MSTQHAFARDNAAILQQGLDLLEGLPDALYAKLFPHVSGSAIGAHIRHNVDHYEAFLRGWQTGRVDYDDRARSARIETDRAHACEQMRSILDRIGAIAPADGDRALDVKMDCGGKANEDAPWARSSVSRELQFLLSHTVHHYAIIAMLARLDGHLPAEGFGVAPSTLKHLGEQAPCAR